MFTGTVQLKANFGFAPAVEKYFFELEIWHDDEPAPQVKQIFGPFDNEAACRRECDKVAHETREMIKKVFGYEEMMVH